MECKYTEKQLDNVLETVNNILSEMEKSFPHKTNNSCVTFDDYIGLRTAYNSLFAVYEETKKMCDMYYPESYLYKKYNLKEKSMF